MRSRRMPALFTSMSTRPKASSVPATMSDIPFPLRRCAKYSPPHFAGDLTDHAQLRPLFVFRQDVALFRRGKTALRGEAELVEIGEFCRFFDASLDGVLGL